MSWGYILTNILFGIYHPKIFHGRKMQKIVFTRGQPPGMYASWSIFSLTHHMFVWLAAERVLQGQKVTDYSILGDDLVRGHPQVAKEYLKIVTEEAGMQISKEKDLVSHTGYLEFAKRFVYNGGEMDLSPISLKVLWAFSGFMQPSYYRDLGVNYKNSVRLKGGGYRLVETKKIWFV